MAKKGRPEGSKSTVMVRLSDLNEHLPPNTIIAIGTTWAKEMQKNFGISLGELEPSVVEVKPVEKQPSKVEIKKIDLK